MDLYGFIRFIKFNLFESYVENITVIPCTGMHALKPDYGNNTIP